MELQLFHPELSGLYVKSVEGLGPVKATINTDGSSSLTGTLFNSATVGNRNIVLDVGMLWAPLIEDARHKLYRYFPLRKRIRLDVKTDYRNLHTYGYVESNDPNIFDSMESSQISIICPDPRFYSNEKITKAFYGTIPLFEFPFSNESLDDPLLELSQVRSDPRIVINYEGDADSGGIISMYAKGPVGDISIYNIDTMESLHIDTAMIQTITEEPFSTYDEIQISTIRGDLYVKLLRNGRYINIISALKKGSKFFQLSQGDNIIAYTAKSGIDNLVVSMTYSPAYEGV